MASIEKSRLKYFSKKCGNQIWILSILDISKVALRWCKSACVQQLLLKIYERKFFFRTVIYILGERLLLNIRKGQFTMQSVTKFHLSPHQPILKSINLQPCRWKNRTSYIYINAIVRLPHPQSGDSQGQETFLTFPADTKTCNYDIECSNHHPSVSTQRSKAWGLSCSKMAWRVIYTQIYQ